MRPLAKGGFNVTKIILSHNIEVRARSVVQILFQFLSCFQNLNLYPYFYISNFRWFSSSCSSLLRLNRQVSILQIFSLSFFDTGITYFYWYKMLALSGNCSWKQGESPLHFHEGENSHQIVCWMGNQNPAITAFFKDFSEVVRLVSFWVVQKWMWSIQSAWPF